MSLVDFSLGDIGGLFTSLREAVTGKKIEDPTEQAKIQLQLEQLEQAVKQGQIEINKAEAASSSVFVAGWRPFIGWIGGCALAYQFIVQPLIVWGVHIYGSQAIPPELDTSMLFNLVLAMLGMGGFRTLEKVKKAAPETHL